MFCQILQFLIADNITCTEKQFYSGNAKVKDFECLFDSEKRI